MPSNLSVSAVATSLYLGGWLGPFLPDWLQWVYFLIKVFLILFFAPVYVPLELLDGWIEGVATVNPVTYLLETGRGFVAGDAPHIAGAFGLAIGLGLLFWVWAFRGLRSAEIAGG